MVEPCKAVGGGQSDEQGWKFMGRGGRQWRVGEWILGWRKLKVSKLGEWMVGRKVLDMSGEWWKVVQGREVGSWLGVVVVREG